MVIIKRVDDISAEQLVEGINSGTATGCYTIWASIPNTKSVFKSNVQASQRSNPEKLIQEPQVCLSAESGLNTQHKINHLGAKAAEGSKSPLPSNPFAPTSYPKLLGAVVIA